MAMSKEQKQQVVKQFQRKDLDTGSSEVQIALITARIKDLAGHFKKHSKDHHGTTGLIKLVNRRRTLLDYLKRTDVKKYQTILEQLGLRK